MDPDPCQIRPGFNLFSDLWENYIHIPSKYNYYLFLYTFFSDLTYDIYFLPEKHVYNGLLKVIVTQILFQKYYGPKSSKNELIHRFFNQIISRTFIHKFRFLSILLSFYLSIYLSIYVIKFV